MNPGTNGCKKRCGSSAVVIDTNAAVSKKIKPSEKLNSTSGATANAATALLSAADRVRRWTFIRTRFPTPGLSLERHRHSSSISNEDDPFNVDDLVVPSKASRVESAVEAAVAQWKDLDSRRVRNVENSSNKPPKRRLGWNEPNFFLPDNFDYKSIRGPPNLQRELHNQPYPRDMVVSLSGNGPGEMQDYEVELWNIFDSIPTEQQLSSDGKDNDADDNNSSCASSIGKARLQTQILKDDIEQGMKRHSTLDGHCLSRLRMRDMHHFPSRATLESRPTVHNTSNSVVLQQDDEGASTNTAAEREQNINNDTTNGDDGDSIIIRIECWKRNLKRGSSADGNKLELEFRGSQTLLDVHKTIQRHTNDVFDSFFQQRHNIKLSKGVLPGTTATSPCNAENLNNYGNDFSSANSGVFFIENIFYTTGPVDYCAPIIQWLRAGYEIDDGNVEGCIFPSRDTVLGITSANITSTEAKPFEIKEMHTVQLKDIPIRLGVRYFHAFNGDLQVSVFFSDVIYDDAAPTRTCKTVNVDDTATTSMQQDHPSNMATTLDPWSFSVSNSNADASTCQGCSHCVAVVICLDDEMTDGSPTALCASCYHNLHYTSKGVLRYNNFRALPIELTSHRLLSVREEQKDYVF